MGRAERLAGRLRAELDYGQIDEIMADTMHAYLENIRQQCAGIHAAIYQVYLLQEHFPGLRRRAEDVAPRHITVDDGPLPAEEEALVAPLAESQQQQ